MTVVQVDGHRIPGYLRQELLFDMLAMAGLSTDRETPPIVGLGIFAKDLCVVHGDLHVAPRISVLTALNHHPVDPSQSPVVVVELEIRQALRDRQEAGYDDRIGFLDGFLLRLVGGRVRKRLASQYDCLRVRLFDGVDCLE